jgi:hypothetical protein
MKAAMFAACRANRTVFARRRDNSPLRLGRSDKYHKPKRADLGILARRGQAPLR